ncbi:hypothetical protein C0971_09960 [Bacillus methanolicus]|uniref:tail fiber protein n=1 Tax=Bacillus methanolicus TaxID=1471 RepID=UPI00200E7FD8|nr:tail fiber protein [Bacillus methanolicus]UQD52298.1 hypothetical protein C0971_09960 [Bacillus methanolicus]
MPFQSKLPEWNKQGAEPPQTIKDNGWEAGQKPPADYFNWFFNTVYLALKELQENGYTKTEVEQVASSLANAVQANLNSHINNQNNPHNVTKSQVGLGNVDNVKQASKTEFDAHTNDTTVHITASERNTWNNKADKTLATQTNDGLMSKSDKAKLDSISSGAETNQNAFTTIKVGSTNIDADSETDTLELVAGTGITLTPDSNNDKVTISGSNASTSVAGIVQLNDTVSSTSVTQAATANAVKQAYDRAVNAENNAKTYADNKATTAETNAKSYADSKAATAEIYAKAYADQVSAQAESNAKAASAPISHVGSGGSAHANATPTTAGFMSSSDKAKLDGIQSGAEVNQNTFSNIKVGSTTISADSKTDTLELVSGANISLTPDATNDKVTIDVTGVAQASHTHPFSDITSKPTTLAGYGITDAVPSSDVVTTATANKILKLDANAKLPASITGNADGNAATASKLQTARTISLSGDVSGSASFDGSANATINATLANSGVTAGTYPKVTVDSKGRVTSGQSLSASDIPNLDWSKITSGKPTTLSGYGISDGVQNAGGTPSIQAGPDGSKPQAGTAGRLYIATDNKKVYRDNGTSWDLIGSINWSDILGKPSTLAGYGITDAIPVSQKGSANGVASLDGSGKVTSSQLPNASTSAPGIVQLNDTVTSTSTAQAATANAAKTAYDRASMAEVNAFNNAISWIKGRTNIHASRATSSQSIQGSTMTVIVWNSINTDTSIRYNSYNPSTGVFTVPENGTYLISAIYKTNTFAQYNAAEMWLYKNGVQVGPLDKQVAPGVTSLMLAATVAMALNSGDTIDIRAYGNVDFTIVPGSMLSISQIS